VSASPPQKNKRRANRRGRTGGAGKADRNTRVFAALDLGTNNCRLLIAQPSSRGFKVIDGFSRIVRLGEGVTSAGTLSEEAIRRTIDALKICATKMKRRRVSHARCVATEAARSAYNSGEFLNRIREDTGIHMEIISSREEAELTLTGCFSLLDSSLDHTLMFDVGGGSAEFVWSRIGGAGQPEIEGWTSLPCGVVTLTERHGQREFTPDEYECLVNEVMNLLRPFDEQFGIASQIASGRAQMVGTAGTVTTIAGVNMSLPKYNRSRVDGSWLEFEAVERISRDLAAKSYDERVAYPCIGHDRADLVVAGCAVLEAVCRLWPAGRLRVADRGVREGILSVMAGQPRATGDGAIAAE
jgi:exopolyphosphatase/guanosine-5'-triphosphate,3'-diphosphate pyrophosphatase